MRPSRLRFPGELIAPREGGRRNAFNEATVPVFAKHGSHVIHVAKPLGMRPSSRHRSHGICSALCHTPLWFAPLPVSKAPFCPLPQLTRVSPESTSRSLRRLRPSRRSLYRSPTRHVTRARWEFTHLVKVFFCTASRSSAVARRSHFCSLRTVMLELGVVAHTFKPGGSL